MTFNDLKKGLMYDFNNETIYEVMKHYNVNYGVAKSYLNDTYYIDDSDNEKINYLREIRDYLDSKNLLIKDKFLI